MRHLFLLLLASALSAGAAAQLDGFLSSENIAQEGNAINLGWTIALGNTCLGTQVDRSIAGGPFEPVFGIAGICGSPEREEHYSWSDEGLTRAGRYTYRLNFGNLGFVTLEIDFIPVWESGIAVQSAPGGMGHTIRVEAFQGVYSIEIYNASGHLVFDSGNTVQRETTLRSESWENGIYIAIVRSREGVIREKFAIYR
jgi:hypothetical protein